MEIFIVSGIHPRISIGLPVFNGSTYLSGAIESVLSQTYAQFELIVCDNASSDSTEEIAKSYAAKDDRIRYFRNRSNVGAAPNFNLAFSYARGEYFNWLAHDDVLAPEFLSRCIEVLDADPSVVLAYSKVTIIDEMGRGVESYIKKLPTDSEDCIVRFNSLLQGHKCFEVFGLMRHNALAKTPLMGGYSMGDGVLLARLSLLGRFVEIPEVLFYSRRHPNQSDSLRKDRRQYSAWFDSNLRNKIVFPWWRTQFEFMRLVHRAPISAAEKMACYRATCVNTMKSFKRYQLYSEAKYGLREICRRCNPLSYFRYKVKGLEKKIY